MLSSRLFGRAVAGPPKLRALLSIVLPGSVQANACSFKAPFAGLHRVITPHFQRQEPKSYRVKRQHPRKGCHYFSAPETALALSGMQFPGIRPNDKLTHGALNRSLQSSKPQF
jgi:hypothetical protein